SHPPCVRFAFSRLTGTSAARSPRPPLTRLARPARRSLAHPACRSLASLAHRAAAGRGVLQGGAPSMSSQNSSTATEVTRDRCQAPDWGPSETAAFIQIWGAEEHQEALASCRRNRSVFAEISEEMARKGYHRSPDECQPKARKGMRAGCTWSCWGGRDLHCRFAHWAIGQPRPTSSSQSRSGI
uniref:Myb/SANT-like DNA-binding domain-containing protein n=1 Tax=Salvator merianae TaxID=96440 RepID=A0A8D0C4M0_SALMN